MIHRGRTLDPDLDQFVSEVTDLLKKALQNPSPHSSLQCPAHTRKHTGIQTLVLTLYRPAPIQLFTYIAAPGLQIFLREADFTDSSCILSLHYKE